MNHETSHSNQGAMFKINILMIIQCLFMNGQFTIWI